MRIIYCGSQFEYLMPKRGLSFEFQNFYLSLNNLKDIELTPHYFEKILKIGKKQYNQELLELVKNEKPDLVFVFMYTEELDKNILKEINKYTKTLAWFADDNWRFNGYARYWAPYFSWCVTTYKSALEKYYNAGIQNVILSQWGFGGMKLWVKMGMDRGEPIFGFEREKYEYDVSFVGQATPARKKIIRELKKRKIGVRCFGAGWPNGRVPLSQMVEIFSNSKINLNLNPPTTGFDLLSFFRLFFKRKFNYVVFRNPIIGFKEWFLRREPQIKARTFEIPGCGGFMITGFGPEIENYYEIGKEIEAYKNVNELAQKIKYYLGHDEERRAIAKAGYDRTIREHTYEKRFAEVFKIIFK